MWALIDNYDSFTYILHDYLLQTGNQCKVFRNDEITVADMALLNPERIIISPGPETPQRSGVCMELIESFYDKIPILGVCLGYQALGVFFGAELVRAPYPMHGKTSLIKNDGSAMFQSMPREFDVMRYHSLVLEGFERTRLTLSARSCDDNQAMAFYHPDFPCVGLQFHPESIGSQHGLKLLKNWADMY